jgi:hypothetical protein
MYGFALKTPYYWTYRIEQSPSGRVRGPGGRPPGFCPISLSILDRRCLRAQPRGQRCRLAALNVELRDTDQRDKAALGRLLQLSCACAKALTGTHPGVRNWLTATRIRNQSK